MSQDTREWKSAKLSTDEACYGSILVQKVEVDQLKKFYSWNPLVWKNVTKLPYIFKSSKNKEEMNSDKVR